MHRTGTNRSLTPTKHVVAVVDQRPFICFNGQKGAIISACLGDWKRAAVPLCWNNKEIMGASLLSVWLLWSFCSFRSGCTKTLNRTGFSRRSPTITTLPTLPTNTAVRWWTPTGIMLLVLNVSFLYWRSCTSKTTMTTTVAVIRKNGRILSKATCLFTQTPKAEKKNNEMYIFIFQFVKRGDKILENMFRCVGGTSIIERVDETLEMIRYMFCVNVTAEYRLKQFEALTDTIWRLWKKNSDFRVVCRNQAAMERPEFTWCFQVLPALNPRKKHHQMSRNWEPNWTGGDTKRESRRWHIDQTVNLFVCFCRLHTDSAAGDDAATDLIAVQLPCPVNKMPWARTDPARPEPLPSPTCPTLPTAATSANLSPTRSHTCCPSSAKHGLNQDSSGLLLQLKATFADSSPLCRRSSKFLQILVDWR